MGTGLGVQRFDRLSTEQEQRITDQELMARVSEPDSRNMKGGFRHDPYQSGNLHTPPHKRAYLGAHAKAPIIYIDELKTLAKVDEG